MVVREYLGIESLEAHYKKELLTLTRQPMTDATLRVENTEKIAVKVRAVFSVVS